MLAINQPASDNDSSHAGGFDFGLYQRNQTLALSGMHPPRTTKTGTTIVGVTFKDGVILGADTRATEGPIVADKNCEKIHYLSPRMYCAGAGTAADTEFTTSMVSSKLALHALNNGRQPRVATAMTMLKQYLFKYQGHISAALILGGTDCTGAHLYTVYPHGSVDKLPFVSMGSGSLAAMSVLESGWRPGMARDEAIRLVADAVKAGIFNDLGSGSNVDVTVITAAEVAVLRNLECPNPRTPKERRYVFPKGTTPILLEEWVDVSEVGEVEVSSTTMDVS